MVIIVLLNVAFTCATPDAMFFFSRRRTRVASLPILQTSCCPARAGNSSSAGARLLLLASDCLGRSLAGARIGMRALAAYRQAAPMAQSAIAAEIHQALDVHRNITPQIAFDEIVAIDHLADLQHFLIGELRDAPRCVDVYLLHDILGRLRADAMDVLQRDYDALVGWDIDASDTCQSHCSSGRRVSLEPTVLQLFQGINAYTTRQPTTWLPGIVKFSKLGAGYVRVPTGIVNLLRLVSLTFCGLFQASRDGRPRPWRRVSLPL